MKACMRLAVDSNEVCQSLERYRELKSSDIPMQ